METIITIFFGIIILIIEWFKGIIELFRSPWAWAVLGFFVILWTILGTSQDVNNRISRSEDSIDSRLSKMEDEVKKLKFMLKRIADATSAELPEDEDEYLYLLEEENEV